MKYNTYNSKISISSSTLLKYCFRSNLSNKHYQITDCNAPSYKYILAYIMFCSSYLFIIKTLFQFIPSQKVFYFQLLE